MSKGQQSITVTEHEFQLLRQRKSTLEESLRARISWGAYLTALSVGALSPSGLSGLQLFCPSCGDKMELHLVEPKIVPKPSPSPSWNKAH